ncbi:hypothetical protein [Bradyrhizobium sp.]|uniref:hypothetical protein n=1 Tax=Bradyrhizobium sp. TaxID=376 RepID=UPI003C77BCE9
MAALPLIWFLSGNDAPGPGFAQAVGNKRRRNCAEIDALSFDQLEPGGTAPTPAESLNVSVSTNFR